MSTAWRRNGMILVTAVPRPADEPDSVIDKLDHQDKRAVKHGTLGGLLKHKRHDEEPCPECIEGGREQRRIYQQKWRNSPMRLQPCGTWAAHQRHRYHGEDPCEDCKAASRAYTNARYVSRKPIAVICDDCGCLCKRDEDCPMCHWNSLQTEQKEAA